MKTIYDHRDITFIAKGQIIRDVAEGTLPRFTTASFAGLHDFVDANEYGGFCAGEVCESLDKQFPRKDDEISEGLVNLMNSVQDTLACWLSEGGVNPTIAVQDLQQLAYMLRAGEPDRESAILSALHRFTPQQILAACAEELVPNEVRMLAVM